MIKLQCFIWGFCTCCLLVSAVMEWQRHRRAFWLRVYNFAGKKLGTGKFRDQNGVLTDVNLGAWTIEDATAEGSPHPRSDR
jgi:hypothetical protein